MVDGFPTILPAGGHGSQEMDRLPCHIYIISIGEMGGGGAKGEFPGLCIALFNKCLVVFLSTESDELEWHTHGRENVCLIENVCCTFRHPSMSEN